MASIGMAVCLVIIPVLARRIRLYVLYGLGIFAALAFENFMEGFIARMFTITRYSEDLSIVDRFSLWQSGWEMFIRNPLFGIGLNGFEAVVGQTPHNSFTQILAEGGITSFLVFMLLSHYGRRNGLL